MCWTRNYDGGRVSWEAMKDRGVEGRVGGPAGIGAGGCFVAGGTCLVQVRL